MNPRRDTALLLLLLLLSSLLAAAVDVELQSVEVSQPAAPRRLGGLQAERDPALSPDGRILVFSREQEYNHDLWALDLDAPPGTSARRLTQHAAPDYRPAFSPDGRWIYFVSCRNDAAGDIWRLRLHRSMGGKLRAGKPQPVIERVGTQDNPVLDAKGRLFWDEEGSGGRRVMVSPTEGQIDEVLNRAFRPQVADSGLWLIREGARRGELGFLADSLLLMDATKRDDGLVCPPGQPVAGSLDFALGTDCLFLIGPTGDDASGGTGLWRFSAQKKTLRPLLSEQREPRQLSVASGRLVVCEGRRQSRLSLWNDWAVVDPAPSAALALSRWEEHQADSLSLLLLRSLALDWPGTPEAARARCEEVRVRMSHNEDPAELAGLCARWRTEATGTEWADRLQGLEMACRMLAAENYPARADAGDRLDRFAQYQYERRLFSVAAECWLELGRAWLKRGDSGRALNALLKVETQCSAAPELAEATLLREMAYEMRGEFSAALGTLRLLAERHSDRPDLLEGWVHKDIERLLVVQGERGVLRVRDRLGALAVIRALRMAYTLELARREAALRSGYREVALEDLDQILSIDPAELNPFETRIFTRALLLRAELLALEGRETLALAELSQQEEKIGAPESRRELRTARVQLRVTRGQRAWQAGDVELSAAEYTRACALDHTSVSAWRGRLRALAASGALGPLVDSLRVTAESPEARAIDYYALGLALSWQAEEDLAQLPESRLWLQRAINADQDLSAAYLTLGWDMARDIELLESRKQGFRAFLSELGAHRERLQKLRFDRAGLLADESVDQLRSRAIEVLKRGLIVSQAQGDSLLAADLAQNLGNLFFSMGEFGAQRAGQAYTARLDYSTHFDNEREELRFRQCRGIALHWEGRLEAATVELDRALELALGLGESELQRSLLGRLGLLASEQSDPLKAQGYYARALALEGNAGQRAMLHRNLALLYSELGERAKAGVELALARQELAEGEKDWPLPDPQNWLRIKLFGLGIPLWNFGDFHTGAGVYHWGPEQERLLQEALEAELAAAAGEQDSRLAGLRLRQRLLKRQGDSEGEVRLQLAIAAHLATQSELSAARTAYLSAADGAADAGLGISVEGMAIGGALNCLLLEQERDREWAQTLNRTYTRLQELFVRDTHGELLPARSRLLLKVLELQLLEIDPSWSEQPVARLLKQTEILMALDALLSQEGGAALGPRDRIQLLTVLARLHLDLGEPTQAEKRLRQALSELGLGENAPRVRLLKGDLQAARAKAAATSTLELIPRELLLRVDFYVLQLFVTRGQRDAALLQAELCFQDFRELNPTSTQGVKTQLRDELLLELQCTVATLDAAHSDDLLGEMRSYYRWWQAQSALLAQPLRLAGESRYNLWRNWQYDLQAKEALRVEWLNQGAPMSGLLCDSLRSELQRTTRWLGDDVQQARELDAHMLLLMQPDSLQSVGPTVPEPGVRWTGSSSAVRLLADNSALGGEWIGLFGSRQAVQDSLLRAASAEALLHAGGEEQEARLLAFDALLHLHRGAPLSSWLEFADGQRLALASLSALEFPGDQLLLRGVLLEGDESTDSSRAWLSLERLLGLCDLRQLWIPATPVKEAEFPALALELLNTGDTQVLCYMLGASDLAQEERNQRLRSGIQHMADLGSYYDKQEQADPAWRSYRRGLDLCLRRGSSDVAGRLLVAAARSAVEGTHPAEALDVLLPLRKQIPAGSYDSRTLARHLSYLADLAGESSLADSLWRTEASVTKDFGIAATFGKSSNDSLVLRGGQPLDEISARRLLDSRLATLKAHGLHQRVAELARSLELRPADEDPVRALFLGKLYLDDGDALRALECLQAEGVLWQNLNSAAGLDRWELISICCQRLDLLPDAARAFAHADTLLATGRWVEARLALHALRAADFALLQGRPDHAWLKLEEARALLPQDDHALWLLYENTSGLIRHQLKEYAEAEQHYQRALDHALRLGVPAELSAVHNNLARSLLASGDTQASLEHCRQAEQQDSLAGGAGHPAVSLRNEALAWLALARAQTSALARRSSLQQATGVLDRADALSGLRPTETAWITLTRLELMLMQSVGPKAEELARTLYAQAKAGDWFELRWRSALVLGRVLQARDEDREAIRLLRDEQGWLNERQGLMPGLRFGGPVREARSELAEVLVDLLASRDRGLEALYAVEQARSSSLGELLRRRAHRDTADNELLNQRDASAAALTLALLDQRVGARTRDSLRTEVDRLQLALDARDTDASGTQRLLAHESHLQRLLDKLDPDDLLLCWQPLAEGGWCLAARDGKVELAPLECNARELDELVGLHRQRLLDLLNTTGSGRRLAELLLDPVLKTQTSPPRRLIVITGGRLQQLPFSTLVLEDGSLLLEHWPLIQSGSLSLLANSSAPSACGPGLVLSDPRVEGVSQLDFAELEGQSIAELWPDVETRSGTAASEEAVRADTLARSFRHFSCHALHDPRSAVASGLLLTPTPGYDGRLDAGELAGLDLPSGLVMLSACETGLGRMGQGDEVNGLPEAFAVAGAASVISSLWKVEDLATAVLVKHLYRALAQGESLDEALRQAQLRVRDSINPHPAYWGAFTLSGSGENPFDDRIQSGE